MRRTPYIKPFVFLFDLIVDTARIIFFSLFDNLVLKRKPTPAGTPSAVLIVRVDAIGDYLFFRPFLEQIKKSEKFKNRQLVLCANVVWREIAEKFDSSLIDRFIWLDRNKFYGSLAYRRNKLAELTCFEFEAAINPTFSRNLFFDDRIIKFVKAREKIGCSGDPGTLGGWRKRLGDKAYSRILQNSPEIKFDTFRNQEFCRLLLEKEIVIPHPLIPPAAPLPDKYRLPARYAVLFISASAPYRKWPLPCFVEIGLRLQRQYGLAVVLCGGPEDSEEAQNLSPEIKTKLYDLVGKTSLLELYSVINNAEILISNETMAPHFASLSDQTPCIVIYNGNNFGRALPYPATISQKHHIVHHPAIAENPEEYARKSNKYGFYNTLDIHCIKPVTVMKKIREVLKYEKTSNNNNNNGRELFNCGGSRRQGLRKCDSPEKPLITIITVVFNGDEFLEQTITSVQTQNYDNIEYIVIDGGSTDNSLDIIRRYEKGIDYWHSAPDHGLYDAMNKGIALASGSIVGIINADDWYNPGILTQIASVHRHNPNSIIHGGMSIYENQQEKYRFAAPEKLDKLPKGMIINHPTVFIPGVLYQRYGAFDTTFKIAADWDLMLRLWRKKISFHALPETVAGFRLGGASFAYNRRQIEEKHAVRVKNQLNEGCDWYYWLDRIKLIFPERWITRASLKKQSILGA